MPIERLRMRPWLEDIINSNKHPGVEWMDKEERIFRLPWKHASRNGWKINSDASLFRAWAEHTGKLKGGKESAKIWKANFRCALNSLPDVEEMREMRLSKGNNAFKVYKIVDRTKKKLVTKRCKGRYPRKNNYFSRTCSVSKGKKEGKDEEKFSRLIETNDVELLEPIEVATGVSFPIPQPCYKSHLVDHDYGVTRYFDLFEQSEKDFEKLHFNNSVPDSTVIKTEPQSPMEEDIEDYSFYEDDNNNSKKPGDCNSRNDEDDKVMSDDEVVELIDELSSDCGSLENFSDDCMERIENDFCQPKQRSKSAPASLEDEFSVFIFPQPTIITKSKSTPDFQSILKSTPQEFLQSCL